MSKITIPTQELYDEKNSWTGGRSLDASTLNYYLPITPPAKILHEFDGNDHAGIDFELNLQTDINAITDGKVIRTFNHSKMGNVVIIEHTDGSNKASLYAHLDSISVEVEDVVNQEIIVGKSGQTLNGNPRLHLELIEGENYISQIKAAAGTSEIGITSPFEGRINPRSDFRFYLDEDLSRIVVPSIKSQSLSGDRWDNKLVTNNNQGPLELDGLEGNDNYYLGFTYQGSHFTIKDSDKDGAIEIVDENGDYFTIEGNAQPKTNVEGEVIANEWTLLQGFDLKKNGTDLIISYSGSDLTDSEASTITIQNYPFEKGQKAFGFTLGKTLDLAAGYDSQAIILTEKRTFEGGPVLKSADGNFFYTTLTQDVTGLSDGKRIRIGKFNSDGILVEQFEVNSEVAVTGTRAPVKYIDPDTKLECLAIPFSSIVSTNDIDQTSVGISIIDGNGVIKSQIIESASSEPDGKYLFQAGFKSQPSDEKLNFAYRTETGSFLQQVSYDLEKIGGKTSTDNNRIAFVDDSIEFSNGNKATLASKALTINLPKLRNQEAAELISNYVVSSGEQRASDSEEKSIISINPSPNQAALNLTVPYNHNSTLVLMAESAFESGRNFTIKLPVEDLSDAYIYSTQLTAEQILNGEFQIPESKRELTEKERVEALVTNNHNAMRVWRETLNDDYSLDPSNISLQEGAQQSTVIVLRNNQKIVLVGSNSTEVEKSFSNYFSIQDPIEPSIQPVRSPTMIPTMIPNPDPTGHPSFLPSNIPSYPPTRVPMYTLNPTGFPTLLPVSHPSSLPTNVPTLYLTQGPTGEPTLIPTKLPSGKPTSLPTLTPSANPSKKPIYTPSNYPTSQPSGLPSPMPSYTPFAIPSISPTGKATYIPSLQPNAWPSGKPTSHPTIYTFNPTKIPSYQPVSNPSALPSGEPTFILTYNPSAIPTEIIATPTTTTSGKPTRLPTIQPSANPSHKPTYTPSNVNGTVIGSIEPTGLPSRAPSRNTESSSPSYVPTGANIAPPTIALRDKGEEVKSPWIWAGPLAAAVLLMSAALAYFFKKKRGARVDREANYRAVNRDLEREIDLENNFDNIAVIKGRGSFANLAEREGKSEEGSKNSKNSDEETNESPSKKIRKKPLIKQESSNSRRTIPTDKESSVRPASETKDLQNNTKPKAEYKKENAGEGGDKETQYSGNSALTNNLEGNSESKQKNINKNKNNNISNEELRPATSTEAKPKTKTQLPDNLESKNKSAHNDKSKNVNKNGDISEQELRPATSTEAKSDKTDALINHGDKGGQNL